MDKLDLKNLISEINEVIPYTYNKQKNSSFENIINKALCKAPTSNLPTFIHMLGIPASGKSTFYSANKNKYKDFVFISFDALMEEHVKYKEDLKNIGSVEAFKKWEISARIAGYELLRRAVEQKKNIFFDHSGAPKCHQELLVNVKKLGYKTQMYYIYCPKELALKRATEREFQTLRHTPINLIEERFESIKNSSDIYKKIVDKFVCINQPS